MACDCGYRFDTGEQGGALDVQSQRDKTRLQQLTGIGLLRIVLVALALGLALARVLTRL